MALTIVPHEIKVQASNAVLATAVSAYTTAMQSAVTSALGVSNVNVNSVTIVPGNIIFDATNYVVSGSVLYKVQTGTP